MRQWLRHLASAGYSVHLLYYSLDKSFVPTDVSSLERFDYDQFIEIPVHSGLVGHNTNGLNVHVDDWCGEEVCLRRRAPLSHSILTTWPS